MYMNAVEWQTPSTATHLQPGIDLQKLSEIDWEKRASSAYNARQSEYPHVEEWK